MRALVIATVLAAGAALASAQPVGTAFTYQGRLTDAGNPASGAYDFQLALFDAAAVGAQVGSTLNRDDVTVVNGLFAVALDFGGVFTGSKRWIEIRVRPGASMGGYTTLAGRQELTPSPNAAFASAVPWTGIDGKPAGFADDVDNDSGGDVTGVTAGTGLTGGGTSGGVTLNVDLGGSGSAMTVARSDHDHFSQAWSGSTANGLTVTNAGGTALRGLTTATNTSPGVFGSGQSTVGVGVHGQALATSGATRGVMGEAASSSGAGVYGSNVASGGSGVVGAAIGGIGVLGTLSGTQGDAIRGSAQNSAGQTSGVLGENDSVAGRGVRGIAWSLIGPAYGVWGTTRSPDGVGGYFDNVGGGPALGVGLGGIRFADQTTQTTASTGDITEVTAGAGLTGGGTSGAVTLSASLGGSGAATTVARSDHDHLGQAWTGSNGLTVTTTSGSLTTASVKGVGFNGVIGESTEGTTGKGVVGINNASFGFADGVFGASASSGGRGVVGYATSPSGTNYGVWGQTDSTGGRAVFGLAAGASGVNYGVYGQTNSPAGYAGYFEGNVGIPGNGKLAFGLTARQVIDLNSPSYGIGVQGGVVYFRTEPPGGMFTWFMGGSHSNIQNDAGPGGVRQMRLDGGGNLFVRGAFSPGGADFAEMLPAREGLEPGDVLAIGPDGALVLTTEPYQDTLAGVYSTKPGLLGGAADGDSTEGKVPLAVTGVVPVKVTDEGGPIAAGDALTSSSTPGHSMKAAKLRVGGVAFYPNGVLIGKALEPLHASTGVIRALVAPQ